MVFFKIKINACILIHPISHYNFLVESFKNTLFCLYCIFFLIFQVTKFFDFTPIFFLGAQLLSIFFLNRILFCTPHFFGFVSDNFFHEGHFSFYNHELWSLATILNSHELNQNNKLKEKACNWSIVLDCEMKSNKVLKFSLPACR